MNLTRSWAGRNLGMTLLGLWLILTGLFKRNDWFGRARPRRGHSDPTQTLII
jgi:hypothetical protein